MFIKVLLFYTQNFIKYMKFMQLTPLGDNKNGKLCYTSTGLPSKQKRRIYERYAKVVKLEKGAFSTI